MPSSNDVFRQNLANALKPYGAIGEFCKATGFSRTAVAKWLEGKSSPSLQNLDIIANAIGIHPSDLIGDKGLAKASNEAGVKALDQVLRLTPLQQKLLRILPALDDVEVESLIRMLESKNREKATSAQKSKKAKSS